MATIEIALEHTKTYANEDTLRRAVNKALGSAEYGYRYTIAWTKEGRCFPIFYGFGSEVQRGINIAMGHNWHVLG